jgi:hypothetical protein
MKIVLLAFAFRLVLWFGVSALYQGQNISTFAGDPKEYYELSQNLRVDPAKSAQFHYTHWYERMPLYVGFLWILTPKIALFVQMLIGSSGVYMMYKMNHKAGIVWNFWEAGYSIIFLKETLLFAAIIFVIYQFKKPKVIADRGILKSGEPTTAK